MIGKAFEFIALIMVVIAELFGMAASGNDRASKTYEERSQYVIEHISEFDNIKDYAYEEPFSGIYQSVHPQKIASDDFKVIEHVVRDDRVKLHNNEDTTKDYLMMGLYGRVDGFSDTAYMYFYGDPATSIDSLSFGKAVYDSSRQCYMIYNAANYREISQITGNWYISVTAYYKDEGFKTASDN